MPKLSKEMLDQEGDLLLSLLKEYTEKLAVLNAEYCACYFWKISKKRYLKNQRTVYAVKLGRLKDYAVSLTEFITESYIQRLRWEFAIEEAENQIKNVKDCS